MTKLVLVDFDLTLTDPEIEELPFMTGCVRDLIQITGLAEEQIQEINQQVRADMLVHPERYNWEYDGHLVSSTVGDPYLRIIPIATAVLDEVNYPEQNGLLRKLFLDNYPKVPGFRPGVIQLLTETEKPTHIVTNSEVTKVTPRLHSLFASQPEYEDRLDTVLNNLRGSAGKHLVHEWFTPLPLTLTLPDFHRPTIFRRYEYFQVLNRLRKLHKIAWEDIVMIGDNFEIDLAVPWIMGARVVLVTNPFTPPWEIEFVQNDPRGFVSSSLEEITEFLKN